MNPVGDQILPSLESFDTLMGAIPGVVFQLQVLAEGDWRFLYVSKGIEDLFHIDAGTLYGDPRALLLATVVEDRAGLLDSLARADRSARSWQHEYRACPDGRLKWVRLQAARCPQPDGSVVWCGILTDVTDQKADEEQLRIRKTQLELALQSAQMGVWDWEIDTGRVAWAGDHAALFGVPEGEFGGTIDDVQAFVHPEDREQGMRAFERTVSEGAAFDNTYRVVWPDGSIRWLHSRGRVIHDFRGVPSRIIGTTQDITQRLEYERKIEAMAHFDALTGLPNRFLLRDRLRHAMVQTRRRGQWIAVVFIDLDGFKAVNDRHGHAVGDQLLIAVATHMRRDLRVGDTLARLGGDEFVAILGDLPRPAHCVPVLERLLAAANLPVKLGELQLQVSASLGVTFYPQESEIGADELFHQADQAMYRAKQDGRHCYRLFGRDGDEETALTAGDHDATGSVRGSLPATTHESTRR